jgi:hypothetical protein
MTEEQVQIVSLPPGAMILKGRLLTGELRSKLTFKRALVLDITSTTSLTTYDSSPEDILSS